MNNDDHGHLEPPVTTNSSFQDKDPTKLKISTSEEFLEPVYLGTDSVCSLMSALGQKQTSRPEISMSALPPKADMADRIGMSAKCLKQTLSHLFDQLVRELLQLQRHF
jgi:hypothetical protein